MSLLRYGDDPAQVVELTLPARKGPHPCVVLLHGGFWRARYDLDLMRPLARAVVGRGLAAANVEYRRVGQPGGGYPGTLRDVAAALERVATIPEIDADRLVVVGHSAGGHLALWGAARVRPAAVIGLAGVCDLVSAARAGIGEDAVVNFLGGTPDEVPDRYVTAAPVVPLGVPTLLVHGDADDRVPVEQSRWYAERAGDSVELVELRGVGHREVIDPAGAAWGAVERWLARWTAAERRS